MTLESSRLAAALADRYTIQRELGAGGMATVYLAHDLRHDRPVAVKVLRPELAAVIGADRFLAEIKTTANLQHPHILPLFDSGVTESFLYYVMPYVEGITLRDRMTREKQLPIHEAVRITTEVASALDYAHRHGVIHRDIKPENILLHDGSALVADFGIALAASKAGTRMTETGMSLGTPSYMSPEQAMGERDLDARSDVYALGCVAYEMFTGEPPFSGPTAQAIVAKVMTSDPVAASSLRRSIPAHVVDAVHTALEKLPADRFATAAAFAAAMGDANAGTRSTRTVQAGVRARRVGMVPLVVLGVVALAAGLALGRRSARPVDGLGVVVAASLDLGDSGFVRPIGGLRLALSPQGDRVAYVGSVGLDAALWVREIGQPEARPYPDTKGAFSPFFSPDGQSIGFFTASGGRIAMKVIPATGGVARTVLTDSVAWFGGASWGDDGNIYFTTAARHFARVPATGGAVTVIAKPDSAQGVKELDFPCVLPGSRHALLMLWVGSLGSNKIGLVDIASGKVTVLTNGSYPLFMPPDRVVIGTSNGQILVARLDAKNERLIDTPQLVQGGVQDESANGTLQFAVSHNGTLVFQPRSLAEVGAVWVDRSGNQVLVDSTLQGSMASPAISPDGSRIALSVSSPDGSHVWVKHLATGSFVRLSGDLKDSDRPVWTRDGRHVAFLGRDSLVRTAWIRRADGSDAPRRLLPRYLALDEIAFDRSGRFTVFRTEGAGTGTRSLLVQERGVDSMPRPLISERHDTFAMAISPDDQWLAYVSEETGTKEIYVRPFPHVDSAKFTVSVGGGVEPLWSRDGRQLYFRTMRGDMMAVDVGAGPAFSHGAPTRLFIRPALVQQDFYRNYDVTLDGKRFLMMDGGGGAARHLSIIFNWRTQLDRGTVR